MKTRITATISLITFLIAACGSDNSVAANAETIEANTASDAKPFSVEVMADFDEPWAMTFIPDTPYALITEKKGELILWENGEKAKSQKVSGVPEVDYGGQGGFGDVVLGPDYANDNMVYLSWIEAGKSGTRGAVVGRAVLNMEAEGGPALEGLKIIWTQFPKVSGKGHYSHRIAFSPNGKYMFIGSGDRQKFDPAQDMDANLGKILRLYPDGSIPEDNPFYTQGNEVRSQIWSLGHRNILGLAFDGKGNLWNHEMGPAGGDELNLVQVKANYGYPEVSNGDHYDGTDIPDHSAGDGYIAPKAYWNPAISPAGLLYYNGDKFQGWKGSLFLGGLGARNLVRVSINGESLSKADQWQMGARIREVEQGPDGAIWLLEDGKRGSEGRMLKLVPKG